MLFDSQYDPAISVLFLAHPVSDALRRFLQEVASAAPTLPFYYYQIPSFTGVNGQWFDLCFAVKLYRAELVFKHM